MKNFQKSLNYLLVLLVSVAANGAQIPHQTAARQPGWAQLTPAQQKVLAPIGNDWDKIPDSQRERLLATVNRFPEMTPEQQQRFKKRLPEWIALTPEQHKLAKERFKKLQSLSLAQKAQVKRSWAEQHPPATAETPE